MLNYIVDHCTRVRVRVRVHPALHRHQLQLRGLLLRTRQGL